MRTYRHLSIIFWTTLLLLVIAILSNAMPMFNREEFVHTLDKREIKEAVSSTSQVSRPIQYIAGFQLLTNSLEPESSDADDEGPNVSLNNSIEEHSFPRPYVYTYQEENAANISILYDISVYSFDSPPFDEHYLISWIYPHVQESIMPQAYGDSVIFIDKTDSYVFWKSGKNFIRISGKYHDIVLDNKFEENEFPNALITAYLQDYPSDCLPADCGKILKPEDLVIEKPTLKEVQAQLYQSYDCPSQASAKKIEKMISDIGFGLQDYTEDEIESMLQSCQNSEKFTGKKLPDGFLQQCYASLKDKTGEHLPAFVNDPLFLEYNSEYLLSECLKRMKFSEKYSAEMQNQLYSRVFEELQDKWDRDFIADIRYPDDQLIAEQQEIEAARKFDPSKEYTLETFPASGWDSSDAFKQAFELYFGRPFDQYEWQEMQQRKLDAAMIDILPENVENE